MIKAIIFDCFGVLVTDGLGAVMDERAISQENRQKIVQLVNSVNKGQIDIPSYRRGVSGLLGFGETEYIAAVRSKEVKNQPLMEYIVSLHKEYKIGMLSNVSSLENLLSRFDAAELAANFDTVVASGQIGFAKPEAQAYQMTAEKLGVKSTECIMVDDREEYCQGAIGVGMQAILYGTFEQMQTELAQILKQQA